MPKKKITVEVPAVEADEIVKAIDQVEATHPEETAVEPTVEDVVEAPAVEAPAEAPVAAPVSAPTETTPEPVNTPTEPPVEAPVESPGAPVNAPEAPIPPVNPAAPADVPASTITVGFEVIDQKNNFRLLLVDDIFEVRNFPHNNLIHSTDDEQEARKVFSNLFR